MGSVLAHCSFSPGPTAYTATGTTSTAASRLTRPLKLQEAPVIEDVKLVGDYGFDPLGLGTDETLVPFREAELKHARLAMLAAVAWPLQEIFHPILVDSLRASGWVNTYDMMAETSGKSPSLLNGGLEQWETAPVLMLAIFCASTLELTDLKTQYCTLALAFATEGIPGEGAAQRTPGDDCGHLLCRDRIRAQHADRAIHTRPLQAAHSCPGLPCVYGHSLHSRIHGWLDRWHCLLGN